MILIQIEEVNLVPIIDRIRSYSYIIIKFKKEKKVNLVPIELRNVYMLGSGKRSCIFIPKLWSGF